MEVESLLELGRGSGGNVVGGVLDVEPIWGVGGCDGKPEDGWETTGVLTGVCCSRLDWYDSDRIKGIGRLLDGGGLEVSECRR